MFNAHIGLFTEEDKQVLERACLIANQSVLMAVISQAAPVRGPGGLLQYDTRPMVDPRENKPASLDWNAELLRYGESVGLLARNPQERHLVRLVRQPQG